MRIVVATSASAAAALTVALSFSPAHDRMLPTLLSVVPESTFVVGYVPAPTPETELGLIGDAKLSIDGRLIVTSDEVEPNVKVFNTRNGSATAFGHADGPGRGVRALAVSDDRILVAWPNPRGIEFYDPRGQLLLQLGPIDVDVRSAIAVSHDSWLLYGPSVPDAGGRSTWVHCLFLGEHRSPVWKHGLSESASDGSGASPILSYASGRVWFEHRGKESSVLSVACGNGDALPVVSLEASSGRLPGVRQYASGDPDEPSIVMPLEGRIVIGSRSFANRTPWQVFVDDGSTVSQVFQVLDPSGKRDVLTHAMEFRILDARDDVGTVVEVMDPQPEFAVVPKKKLSAWLSGSGARGAHN